MEAGSHFRNHSFDILNFSFDSACFLLMHSDEIWSTCQRMINVLWILLEESSKYGKALCFLDIPNFKNKKESS